MRASRSNPSGLIVGTLLAVSSPTQPTEVRCWIGCAAAAPVRLHSPRWLAVYSRTVPNDIACRLCSRVVVNYVPHTAYRTTWEQVPVTQYRPVTTHRPLHGLHCNLYETLYDL
jgi:hypothetical protein